MGTIKEREVLSVQGSLTTPLDPVMAPQADQSAEPPDRYVPDLVTVQAAATPDAVAVAASDQVLTYRDLEIQSNQLARHLRSLGVGPEVVVGICVERSAAMVMGSLAVLKAGGAYIPMDPTYPAERLAFMLRDAQAPVLLTDRRRLAHLPSGGWQGLALDAIAPLLARHSGEPLAPSVVGEDLAYVVYTSGSTGTPKGVQITHDNLLNLVNWHRHAFAVTAADRATQLAGPGFDAVIWEVWPYLTAGACVVIADDATRVSAPLLRDWLVANQITISFLPTVLAEAVMALDWPPGPALRILLTGAETLRRYPSPRLPFRLVNNYGPSEATVVATSGPVPPCEQTNTRPTIGYPIANVQIHILDPDLRPVAAGTAGELCIGGANVARGYLNRPDLTAEKFVPDPWSATPDARMFRTGDQARVLPDGQIAFLGRRDGQVKIRGYRIETDEVIAALNQHPAIQNSLVAAREDTPGETRLVAYLVPGPEPLPTLDQLREFLAGWLPEYMIPATFVHLSALPLTANGKVDTAALPAPDLTNTLRDADYVAPRTPTEERLAAILAGVLEMDRVGIEDNFFMLGGHSLLGTQVIARVADAFGVEISLYTLFAEPTVAELADEVEQKVLAMLEGLSEDEAARMLG